MSLEPKQLTRSGPAGEVNDVSQSNSNITIAAKDKVKNKEFGKRLLRDLVIAFP
jgi:hypothetical protein